MKIFTPKSLIRSALFIGMILMAPLIAFTQLPSKSDLSITSITIADDIPGRNGTTIKAKTTFSNLKCTITINNNSGDMATQPKVVVTLPEFITLVSVTGIYVKYSTLGQRGWPGTLVIDLDNIQVGDSKIVEIIFTRSQNANTIGAYAFSGCPDPNPSNNFKQATY